MRGWRLWIVAACGMTPAVSAGAQPSIGPFAAQGRVVRGNIDGDQLLVTLNRDGAVVAIHDPTSNQTDAFDGTIDHVGHDDQVIYWGLWRTGTLREGTATRPIDEALAVPYIVGTSTRMVPIDGVAAYTMIGETGVVSSRDMQRNLVPTGTVQSARAVVDFKNRRVQLDLTTDVRGTTATMSFPMTARTAVLGLRSGAESTRPCQQAPQEWCPHAEAHFYGPHGEYLGVTFLYAHTTVLPESAWVPAHLANVYAQGAVVLHMNQR